LPSVQIVGHEITVQTVVDMDTDTTSYDD